MKRNRIFLDFTTLLDITMIILFWFILKSDASANEAEKAAQEQIAQAQSIIEQAKEDKNAFEAEKDEWQKKADEQLERISNADKNAAANQKALEELDENNMLHIYLNTEKNDDGKWIKDLALKSGRKTIGDLEFEDPHSIDITEEISAMLDDAGLKKENTIICIFVYDGDQYGTAAVRDEIVQEVRKVSHNYPQFYCAVIDISK